MGDECAHPCRHEILHVRAFEIVVCAGEDPHQYGLTPYNRANLAALLDFLYRLGSLERVLEPEELFI